MANITTLGAVYIDYLAAIIN